MSHNYNVRETSKATNAEELDPWHKSSHTIVGKSLQPYALGNR
jgi:hypothetical protein